MRNISNWTLFIELKDQNNTTCGGNVMSSNPPNFDADWICDKCGTKRKWNNDDLAGIENNLSERLDDNENDIKVNNNNSCACRTLKLFY